jgi:hypothetical protein
MDEKFKELIGRLKKSNNTRSDDRKVLDEHIEVTVDYEDVSPGYFSGNHRKGQKGYQFKMLED